MSEINKYRKYFNDSKYTKWYFNIIENALKIKRQKLKWEDNNFIYYEHHHIVPKCLNPKLSSLIKHKSNGVLLTTKEHVICHWLLCKMGKKWEDTRKLNLAFNCICLGGAEGNQRFISVALTSIARQKIGVSLRGIKRKRSVPKWFYGDSLEELEIYLIKSFSQENKNNTDIAKIHGVTGGTILYWRKYFNIEFTVKNYLNKIPYDFIYQKYVIEGLTMKEISSITGVSDTNISYVMKHKYKIPARKRRK